ncbi:D-alanyl-D-alanine carboxypeptidase family protein [Parasphingorhabdus sp. SCSIO 66989]|uniref:serine-type D-Ala-D-Ala carboxypeptidase n=2 Tax=Alterisphingorhabdus coralli TaxID=3071408 RepID=A0AA97FAK9_9SPHN|nr:D-alanyl-D-alanine carboxypeptidase family protein [Parasphingorhabdus sp. SCSIO 66989]WOE76626.1 D-alanyl-D-alanine carboxypeptidase family protein [Parasphingorhabdus sp. SCSIO 66989]
MIRTLSLTASACALFGTAVFAANPSYDSNAPIAYLTDLSSGAVLLDKDADRKIPPASMAKMMTVYVAFDLVKKGELSLEDNFTVQNSTWQKWNNQGSTMFLKAGQKVSVGDLLHGIITLSGNDACVVLAEGIAGTEPAFVDMMNDTAARIGMKNSRFGNSNGWPDEGRTLVTARDLAKLGARSVMDFPDLYTEFYGQESFSWNGITQQNRNPIIGRINGADGLKTGHTEEAGFGFAGTAEQNGRRLMMVVAGLDTYNGRIEESVKLLNWGFRSWKSEPLFAAGDIIGDAQVQLGSSRSVPLVAPRNLAVTLPRRGGEYSMKIVYDGPVKAPFKAGANIASLVITPEEGKPQILPLAAGETVEEAGFFLRIWNGIAALFGA